MGKESDAGKIAVSLGTAFRSFAAGDVENGISQLAAAGGLAAFAYGKYTLTERAEKILKDKAKEKTQEAVKAKATKDAFGTETWILDRAIWFISIVELLFGGGADKGEKFKLASRDFELAYRTLADAGVDDRDWSGDAAAAYDARNAEQMARALKMSELDLDIAAVLKKEVEQLKEAKFVLAQCKNALTAAVPIAMSLRLIVPAGEYYSFMFQMACVTGTIPTVIYRIKSMLLDASDNADDIKAVAQEYLAVAAGAVVTGSDSASSGVQTASAATVGEFSPLSAATGVAGGVAPRPEVFAGYERVNETASATADVTGATEDASATGDSPQLYVPPAYRTPTASGVAQAPTQGVQFSPQPATAPAKPAAAAAGPDIEAGASGADEAGRVPLEVAAGGADQGQATGSTRHEA